MKYLSRITNIFTRKAPQYGAPTQELIESIGEEMKVILQEAYENEYLN